MLDRTSTPTERSIMNTIVPQEVAHAINVSVKNGATHYRIAEGCVVLEYENGTEALRLPHFAGLPAQNKQQARYLLEAIAWEEHAQLSNRVVWVREINGYDASNTSHCIHLHQPIRVRVSEMPHPADIANWTDDLHLDPIWDVALVDQHLPQLTTLRWLWVYSTSRSLDGTIERSDVIRPETTLEYLRRALTHLRSRFVSTARHVATSD